MTSTIKFYDTKLRPEKNYILDTLSGYKSLLDYLSTLTPLTISNFQYIKHGLYISIKVDRNQANLDSVNQVGYNYVSIINSEATGNTPLSYYYFIMSAEWKGQSTIQYNLKMDVLNTFMLNDSNISKKTLIHREHIDRFNSTLKTGSSGNYYSRIVDLKEEDVNPALYKTMETYIYENTESPSFYLYYKNDNNPQPTDYHNVQPVQCLLVPREPLTNLRKQNATITSSDIGSNNRWYFSVKYNFSFQLNVDGTIYEPNEWSGGFLNADNYDYVIELYYNGTNLYVNLITFADLMPGHSYSIISKETITNPTSIKLISNQSSVKYYKTTSELTAYDYYHDEIWKENAWNDSHSMGADVLTAINGLNSIDRTDSKNIKLINLPYCPSSYSYDSLNKAYIFDTTWSVDGNNLKLVSFYTKFINEFTDPSLESPINELYLVNSTITSIKTAGVRNDAVESKIFHSSYLKYKFVYDSFSLSMYLENVNTDTYWNNYYKDSLYAPNLVVKFVCSRNMVSKFLFSFPQYSCKYSTQDYENVLLVSRNNEEVLYTSEYINYIRTGYNFDIKNKERNQVVGALNIGVGALRSLAGSAIGVATGNNFSVEGAVGSGFGIASSLISYIKSVAESEDAIQRKLVSAENQAISVRNVDDIDLLEEYGNNKLKMCKYELSPVMKEAMLDLFYYYGYRREVQAVPDVRSRHNFNFLQCDLVLDSKPYGPALTNDLLQEIYNKYAEGVIYLHKYEKGGAKWDFEQETENLEVFFYS